MLIKQKENQEVKRNKMSKARKVIELEENNETQKAYNIVLTFTKKEETKYYKLRNKRDQIMGYSGFDED